MRAARLLLAAASLAAPAAPAAAQQVTIDGGTSGAVSLPAAVPMAVPTPPPPVQTVITPDTGTLGLGTIVNANGNVRVIDGGTRAGANLFHSFTRFDLARGDIARWVRSAGDGADIRFVINRVTGGDASDIAGTINTMALPNADFYFINPSGIFFSEGASINVAGAAHFSTAQNIRFASGPDFTIATPGGSTLSVASPAAFGFVGGQRAIGVTGTDFGFLRPASSLTLAASDIRLTGSQMIGRGIRLFAVGSGAMALDPAGPLQRLAGGIEIVGSLLRLSGNQASPPTGILLSGGRLDLKDAGLGNSFFPDEPFHGVAGPITLFGSRISIFSGLISASTAGTAPAGDIRIIGDDIMVAGAAIIQTETRRGSTGRSGSITIAGGNISLTDETRISANTLSDQRAGDIDITARAIVMEGGALITSSTLTATTGDAGDIRVTADSLTMRTSSITSSTSARGAAGLVELRIGGLLSLTRGQIQSSADGTARGPAGTLDIVAGRILLDDSATLSTTTFGFGRAGQVTIMSPDITILNDSFIASESVNGAAGNAGLVSIDGGMQGRLTLDRGGAIRSSTTGAGDAGGVFIRTGDLSVLQGSRISSSATAAEGRPVAEVTGDAGDVIITAASILVTSPRGSDAAIESRSDGSGDAGFISLDTGRLTVSGQAEITTETGFFGSGDGGDIDIVADEVLVEQRASISASSFGIGAAGSVSVLARRSILVDSGGVIRSEMGVNGTGQAGTVTLDSPFVHLTRSGRLSAQTSGFGDSGRVFVSAGRLLIDFGGGISTATLGDGAGGTVAIAASEVILAEGGFISADSFGSCLGTECFASGPAGAVDMRVGQLTLIGATNPDASGQTLISSSTRSYDDAGGVLINAARGVTLRNGAQILSVTNGRGDAGDVQIAAGSLVMETGSIISTSSALQPDCDDCGVATGNAGIVGIRTIEGVAIRSGSQILSTTQGPGNAGQIGVDAGRLLLLENGRISTQVGPGATGLSGIIAVAADQITLTGIGRIDTTSFSASEAGGVLVEAGRLTIVGTGAGIASANQAQVPGNAGGIFITADAIDLLDGGRLTTESRLGAAGSIEIFLPDTGFLTLDSRGAPSLITTSSGPGTGGRIFVANPYTIISNGGVILALGQEGGANVSITTRYFITSADRFNQVSVNGAFLLEAQAYDVSMGTVSRYLTTIDASGVLRGQCAAARSTGQVSQLVVRPVGPYGRPVAPGSGIAPGSCL